MPWHGYSGIFGESPKQEQIVFHDSDYFEKVDDELGNTVEWIIPNAQKNIMEPIRLTLKPGGSTYPDNPHEGEEFGYVLSGSITIIVGKKAIRAKKGESFYFIPNTTHYITANQKQEPSSYGSVRRPVFKPTIPAFGPMTQALHGSAIPYGYSALRIFHIYLRILKYRRYPR